MASPIKTQPLPPAEWDDSCSCFLVLCSDDLESDPDQRLRLFSHASQRTLDDAYAYRRCLFHEAEVAATATGAKHGKLATVSADVHADPQASSPPVASARNVSTWLDVLLAGVQDPWSRVREVARSGLCASVVAVVANEDPSAPLAVGASAPAEEEEEDANNDDEEAHACSDEKHHTRRASSRAGRSSVASGRGGEEGDSFVMVSASSTPQRRSSVASGSYMNSGVRRGRTGSVRATHSVNMTALSGVSSVGHSPQPVQRLSFGAVAATRTPIPGPGERRTPLLVTPTKQQLEAQKEQRRFLLDVVSKLFVKWKRTQHWYEREGMLRAWQQLLPIVMAVAEDTVAKVLVQKVCLPALSDPQVPVRDAASTLLASIAGSSPVLATVAMTRVRESLEDLAKRRTEDDSATKPDEASAYAAEGYLKGLLKLCEQQDAHRGELDESSLAETAAGPHVAALEAFAPLLMQFASHPASSVRQCVAAALGTHSEALFGVLIRSLGSTASPLSSMWCCAEDANSPVAPQTWQAQETVLMALSEHLRFYLAQDCHYQLDLIRLFATPEDHAGVEAFCAGEAVSPGLLAVLRDVAPSLDAARQYPVEALAAAVACARKFVTMEQCLCLLCDAAQSSRFEVSRMGLQVVPLFLQLWVRFSTHVGDLFHVLYERVPPVVFVNATVEVLAAADETRVGTSASLSPPHSPSCAAIIAALAENPAFYFYTKAVLAPLWWYLAVRVYASRSPGCAGAGEFVEPAVAASLVKHYGVPQYWVRCVSKQYAAVVASSRGGGKVAAADDALLTADTDASVWGPLLPHLCSAHLLIATYFAGLFDTEEARVADPGGPSAEAVLRHLLVLEPPLWEALLAKNPPHAAAALRTAVPTRQYVHVGIDFVAGVCWRYRHRGGGDGRGASLNDPTPAEKTMMQVQSLVPVWMGALASLQTHQQCAFLCMTRIALGVDALLTAATGGAGGGGTRRSLLGTSLVSLSGGGGDEPHLFRFVYRSTLRAPVMLDGGEDVPRGFMWLRWCFPVEVDAPVVAALYLAGPLGENGRPIQQSDADAEERDVCEAAAPPLEPSVGHAVDVHVLKALYADPGVEPSVLREVRLLMGGLCASRAADAWRAETVAAVFRRLDRIDPNWMVSGGSGGDGAAKKKEVESDDWDDWDDDSEEDEAVQGISSAQEVREAKSLLTQVLLLGGGGNGHEDSEAVVRDVPNAYQDKVRTLFATADTALGAAV